MQSTVENETLALEPRGFGRTTRRDAWWATPLGVFVVLSAFVVYATWAAFQNAHYTYGPYLSPFYSPELFGSPRSWFGPKPAFLPEWLPFSRQKPMCCCDGIQPHSLWKVSTGSNGICCPGCESSVHVRWGSGG
jgi:hypothetical protein